MCITAGIGALVGGGLGFGGSVATQLIRSGGDFSKVIWRDARAAAAGGAVSGALAGLTLGASALAEAGVGTVMLVGAGSNAVGGAVQRSVDSDPNSKASNIGAIAEDAIVGAAGGYIGAKLEGGIKSSLPAVKQQIENSIPKARMGDFGAAQSVKGHISKAARIERNATVTGIVVDAQATNAAYPVAKAVIKKE